MLVATTTPAVLAATVSSMTGDQLSALEAKRPLSGLGGERFGFAESPFAENAIVLDKETGRVAVYNWIDGTLSSFAHSKSLVHGLTRIFIATGCPLSMLPPSTINAATEVLLQAIKDHPEHASPISGVEADEEFINWSREMGRATQLYMASKALEVATEIVSSEQFRSLPPEDKTAVQNILGELKAALVIIVRQRESGDTLGALRNFTNTVGPILMKLGGELESLALWPDAKDSNAPNNCESVGVN